MHRHPVHTRLSLIGANPPVRANDVFRVAYLLHQINCQGSLLVECRERLLRSMCRGADSVRPAVTVVLLAFLLRHVHRILPSAPCTKDSALRPVGLLWRLLTSLLLSPGITAAVVRCERTRAEISRGKTCLLLPNASDLPATFRMTIGLPRPWPGDPTLHGLVSASCTSRPKFRRRLSSDSASRRTPLLRRMVPVINGP